MMGGLMVSPGSGNLRAERQRRRQPSVDSASGERALHTCEASHASIIATKQAGQAEPRAVRMKQTGKQGSVKHLKAKCSEHRVSRALPPCIAGGHVWASRAVPSTPGQCALETG
eukprot:scaffold43683_cov20-Tisochrysis_lutea.AAC.2